MNWLVFEIENKINVYLLFYLKDLLIYIIDRGCCVVWI